MRGERIGMGMGMGMVGERENEKRVRGWGKNFPQVREGERKEK